MVFGGCFKGNWDGGHWNHWIVISRETLQESASHFTNGQGLWFFTLFLKTNPIIIVIVIMMMMMLMMINITSFLIVLICFLESRWVQYHLASRLHRCRSVPGRVKALEAWWVLDLGIRLGRAWQGTRSKFGVIKKVSSNNWHSKMSN